MIPRRWRTSVLLIIALASPCAAIAAPADTTALGLLRADADSLRTLVRSPLGRAFLAVTAELPRITPRVVWRDSARTAAWTDAEAGSLPDSLRSRLVSRELDESFYWNTRYGSPLAYVRALELLSENGFRDARGKRVADFGCGMVGQLRLLALLGADATGIDVDPLLRALYTAPGDQGPVTAASGRTGRVRLAIGSWPSEARMKAEVGDGYDLFLSKNTLKNGYLHPAEKVDPRMLVHLGVSDSAFVAELYRTVRPAGLVMIYNLCPAVAPAGKPYIPWADGRCPFAEAQWRAAGFRVRVFDRDDSRAARAMGRALGWGRDGMDLEHDLFATWSLFEKPGR
jgi:SAM-dependent methyltransferase